MAQSFRWPQKAMSSVTFTFATLNYYFISDFFTLANANKET